MRQKKRRVLFQNLIILILMLYIMWAQIIDNIKMIYLTQSETLPDVSQSLCQKLRVNFQKNCTITENLTHQFSFVPNLSSQKEGMHKIEIRIKENGVSMVMEGQVVGKIGEAREHDQMYYLNLVQKINTTLCLQDVVFWLQKNKNFGIRKIMPSEIAQTLLNDDNQLMKREVQYFQELLNKCIKLAKEEQINHREKTMRLNKAMVEKKILAIQNLKFQLEVNRRQRPKATSNDFNSSKIKNIEGLLHLKERCDKQNKNYMMALRENMMKNETNPKDAANNYLKILEEFKKKQEKKKISNAEIEKEKILNAIKMVSYKKVEWQNEMEGTFSHINIIESSFDVLFSLNLKTAQFISESTSQNGSNLRKENCLLVEKKKCLGCSESCKQNRKVNQNVFQNEKQMLMKLNPYYHDYICSFYIELQEKGKAVNSIYSKKLPGDPIQRFLENQSSRNFLKTIKKILKFVGEVCEGVKFLQSCHIIHRDLKPTNVLLDHSGVAKIIDFGSSSPIYLSPLEKNVSKNFDYKLRSTKGYYSKYVDLPGEINRKYTKEQYDRHTSFDVYSLGSVLQFFICNAPSPKEKSFAELSSNISYFIKRCKDIHPDDRITPLEATLFLKQIHSLASYIINSQILVTV